MSEGKGLSRGRRSGTDSGFFGPVTVNLRMGFSSFSFPFPLSSMAMAWDFFYFWALYLSGYQERSKKTFSRYLWEPVGCFSNPCGFRDMSDIRSFFKPSQKGAKKEVKKEEKEEKESFEKEQEKEKKQQLQEKKRKAKKKPAFASTAPKVTTTPPKEKSLKRVEREDNEEDFLERPRKRPRKMNDNEDDDFLIEDADLAFSSGSGKKVKKPSPSPSEKKSSPRKLPLTITKAKGDDEKEEWIEKDPLPKETNLKPQPKPQLKSQPKSQPKSKENEEKKENLGDKQMSGYRSFMSRGAPPLKGSKNVDIEGKPYCLYNYHFLVTGVLESLEREDIHELITKYGGKVCKSLTKKCTHIVIGSDPGQAKIAQLEKRSDIVQLKGEDAFLELIRTNPGKSLSRSEKEALTPKIKIQKLTAPPPKKSSNSSSLSSSSSSSSSSAPQRSYSSLPNPHPASPTSPFRPPPSPSSPAPFSPSSPSPFSPSSPSSPSPLSLSSSLTSEPPVDDRLWTEKWRPRKLSDLVANKTAATNLQGWLKKWTNSSPKKAALIGGSFLSISPSSLFPCIFFFFLLPLPGLTLHRKPWDW